MVDAGACGDDGRSTRLFHPDAFDRPLAHPFLIPYPTKPTHQRPSRAEPGHLHGLPTRGRRGVGAGSARVRGGQGYLEESAGDAARALPAQNLAAGGHGHHGGISTGASGRELSLYIGLGGWIVVWQGMVGAADPQQTSDGWLTTNAHPLSHAHALQQSAPYPPEARDTLLVLVNPRFLPLEELDLRGNPLDEAHALRLLTGRGPGALLGWGQAINANNDHRETPYWPTTSRVTRLRRLWVDAVEASQPPLWQDPVRYLQVHVALPDSLVTLCLRGQRLGDAGAYALAALLWEQRMPLAEELDLAENGITDWYVWAYIPAYLFVYLLRLPARWPCGSPQIHGITTQSAAPSFSSASSEAAGA